jgi:hypothetical protein
VVVGDVVVGDVVVGDVVVGDVVVGDVVVGDVVVGDVVAGDVVAGDVVAGDVVVGDVDPPSFPAAPVVFTFTGGLGTEVSDFGRTDDSTDTAFPSVQEEPPPWTRVQVSPVTLMTAAG